MWLGIVLHASVNYMVGPTPTPWHDSQSTLTADLLVVFVHAFRMPVFFILAGFFVAMLVAKKGVEGMLRQRVRRLVLPFVIFWPLLLMGMGALVALYVHLNVFGTPGFNFSIVPKIPGVAKIGTMHLWFVYYLFLFCLTTAFCIQLSRWVPPALKAGFTYIWRTVAASWWGFVVLALPLAVVGSFYRGGIVTPNGSFIPDLPEFVHSGWFFVFGYCLYRHQASLLDIYVRYRWRYLATGLLLMAAFLLASKRFEADLVSSMPLRAGMAFLYNCVSWVWSFALLGLFLKYLPQQNRVLAYLADSSYWVYLVHMLGTIGFGALLFDSPFGAPGRLCLNILLTTLACLASYQLLVRHTPVGSLLNGRSLSSHQRTPNLPEH